MSVKLKNFEHSESYQNRAPLSSKKSVHLAGVYSHGTGAKSISDRPKSGMTDSGGAAMSASNTAHVPMDEPHLSRYGANAARALELEGAAPPGTVAAPGDAARAGRGGGARPAGAGPLGRGERAHAGSGGAGRSGQRLSGGAGGADGGAGLPQGQAPATPPERPVCSPVCRPGPRFGPSPRPGPPPPDGLSLRVPVRTAPHRTGGCPGWSPP